MIFTLHKLVEKLDSLGNHQDILSKIYHFIICDINCLHSIFATENYKILKRSFHILGHQELVQQISKEFGEKFLEEHKDINVYMQMLINRLLSFVDKIDGEASLECLTASLNIVREHYSGNRFQVLPNPLVTQNEVKTSFENCTRFQHFVVLEPKLILAVLSENIYKENVRTSSLYVELNEDVFDLSSKLCYELIKKEHMRKKTPEDMTDSINDVFLTVNYLCRKCLCERLIRDICKQHCNGEVESKEKSVCSEEFISALNQIMSEIEQQESHITMLDYRDKCAATEIIARTKNAKGIFL